MKKALANKKSFSVVHLSLLALVIASAATIKGLAGLGLAPLPSFAAGGISAPSNIETIASGGNIAVRWNAVGSAAKYKVYRNGSTVATLSVGGAAPYTFGSTVYYDTSVSTGRTYSYQVAAVTSAGMTSAKSSSVSVVAPATITQVPTVTTNNGGQRSLNAYLQNGSQMLKYWYPKIADRLVGRDHKVPSTINLVVSTAAGCNYAASTSGTTITICAAFANSSPNDMSMFTHEGTHIIQQYATSVPGGIVEGMASWAADWTTAYVQPLPAGTSYYDDGYAPTSYFLSWITRTYNLPNFVRDVNLAAYHGTYADSIFTQKTGQSIGQLWTTMSGHRVSSPGELVGPNSKCSDLAWGDSTDGNTVQLLTCYGGWAQQYVYTTSSTNPDAGLIRFHYVGKCLVPAANGKTAGTRVVIGACDYNNISALWQPASNGSVVNTASQLCLAANGAIDGTPLQLDTCQNPATNAYQNWRIPPQ